MCYKYTPNLNTTYMYVSSGTLVSASGSTVYTHAGSRLITEMNHATNLSSSNVHNTQLSPRVYILYTYLYLSPVRLMSRQ